MCYLEEIKEDIREYIREEIEYCDYEDIDELEEQLNEDLWIDDSVTGNASGSYYCNSYKAREKVLAEIETVTEAYREFCQLEQLASDLANGSWESMDVTARCYLLSQAIGETMTEIEEEFDEAKERQALEEVE